MNQVNLRVVLQSISARFATLFNIPSYTLLRMFNGEMILIAYEYQHRQ